MQKTKYLNSGHPNKVHPIKKNLSKEFDELDSDKLLELEYGVKRNE